jgi:hypothetical protein
MKLSAISGSIDAFHACRSALGDKSLVDVLVALLKIDALERIPGPR